ncbi:MAG: winged helix-turn-helix transcriptional regulator [Nitrospiraceae bacterium]|nr:MAG: winged helix-turn-helix transcriptional regulator [Nitrospiraceae bacterium]
MNNAGPERNDAITLKILDEISRESLITQRSLSSRLDIALGLINTYIKRLAKQGYIKITKGPMNRLKYAVTPKGFSHRVGLTYTYMNSSMKYFSELRLRIDGVYRAMILSGVKDILIWGDGEIAELSYISLRGLPLNLLGVVDGRNEEKGFFGYNIYSLEDLATLHYDAILIASFSKEDIQRVKALDVDEKKIYLL